MFTVVASALVAAYRRPPVPVTDRIRSRCLSSLRLLVSSGPNTARGFSLVVQHKSRWWASTSFSRTEIVCHVVGGSRA
jgi:hypothetical protein